HRLKHTQLFLILNLSFMRKIFLFIRQGCERSVLIAFLFATGIAMPATAQVNVWSDIPASSLMARTAADIIPVKYRGITPNQAVLKDFLFSLPPEKNIPVRNSEKIMALPMPDGSYQNFRVVESPIMEKALSDKYP